MEKKGELRMSQSAGSGSQPTREDTPDQHRQYWKNNDKTNSLLKPEKTFSPNLVDNVPYTHLVVLDFRGHVHIQRG